MSSQVRRLFGVACAALALFVAGCGMEAAHNDRQAIGATQTGPFAVQPEQAGWVCANELPATENRAAGPCLQKLDSSMTCPTCKISFRRPDEPDPTIGDVAQIVDAIKTDAEPAMRKAIEALKEELKKSTEELKIDPAKIDAEFNPDKLIDELKADKDAAQRNPIERMAEIERMKWESEKKHLGDSGAKTQIAFLKPGAKPLALPLLLCPNDDCKKPVDPAGHACRECGAGYIVAPLDTTTAAPYPLASICPSCGAKQPVNPMSNLCEKCGNTYRNKSLEAPCWRCGGTKLCPECGGSGSGLEASGGLGVCWACAPATAGADATAAKGNGLCSECQGKGYIDYDPALPPKWTPIVSPNGKTPWKLEGETATPASTKPSDSGKPEKDEGK